MSPTSSGPETGVSSADADDLHVGMANAIRFLSADAVQAANSGHPGMPMGMADVATVLFTRFLKYDAAQPDWPDRDRFVLSAGHGSMLLYSLLYLTGYPGMDLDQLKNFRQLGSKTAGHPEFGHAPGIETTTGPLGQGIATAVGLAMAERLLATRFGAGVVDHHTYVIAGDGCLMEGVSHEAISMAGHLKLSKLIVLWDDNQISIDGGTDLSVSDDQEARFQASGWHTLRVDAHDQNAVAAAIEAAKADPRPSMIACRSVIGFGAPNKQGTAATHGAPLGDEELALMRDKLGWRHPPFEVPADVVDAWRTAGSKGSEPRVAWEERAAGSGLMEALAQDWTAEADAAFAAFIAKVREDKPKWATRKASGEVLAAINSAFPALVGGSADLTGSVNTKAPGLDPITPEDFSGRYVHYGVREHGMAAAMNGMALHGGLRPYAGTFLVFADYMRPAMRLSALMEQPVIYVLTHDSIGLGEDGPTHQPVETLASLRAMPNFHVFRPCDPVEAAECWEAALKHTTGPSGLVLSRQGVPFVRTDDGEQGGENKSSRGAYVLSAAEGEREATILATGSEVSIALEAQARLKADGIETAVVSVPCFEAFAAQDQAYRDQVLGAAPRVAVEAAIRQGWDALIGAEGGFVGMEGFGASAPAGDLYKHFGITADAVVQQVRDRL